MPAKGKARLTVVQKKEVLALRLSGLTNSEIGKRMGLHEISVCRLFRGMMKNRYWQEQKKQMEGSTPVVAALDNTEADQGEKRSIAGNVARPTGNRRQSLKKKTAGTSKSEGQETKAASRERENRELENFQSEVVALASDGLLNGLRCSEDPYKQGQLSKDVLIRLGHLGVDAPQNVSVTLNLIRSLPLDVQAEYLVTDDSTIDESKPGWDIITTDITVPIAQAGDDE